MPIVNNKTYIELAKADFNICQSIHMKELHEIIRKNSISAYHLKCYTAPVHVFIQNTDSLTSKLFFVFNSGLVGGTENPH